MLCAPPPSTDNSPPPSQAAAASDLADALLSARALPAVVDLALATGEEDGQWETVADSA
jgi:hypothetical protein